MSSAWGSSWGSAWGSSWGSVSASGDRRLWLRYSRALRHPDIRETQPRLLISEDDVRKRILQEAQGNATWARYANGAPKGDLNIEVYVTLAVASDLEPS